MRQFCFAMEKLKKIWGLIGNKYVLAALIFAAVLLVIDENNVFQQAKTYRELTDIEDEIEMQGRHIEEQRDILRHLAGDSVLLEKIAREKYMMKKQNEEIYVIQEK